ncbi:hypothetical protein COO60DRAFT_202852 [Scenedesmus sp. NREL 46B-D3]|nr:hypothetical protein COO60DRAFT_202852 [Scenedesmus sp. NREL 46B-D3]
MHHICIANSLCCAWTPCLAGRSKVGPQLTNIGRRDNCCALAGHPRRCSSNFRILITCFPESTRSGGSIRHVCAEATSSSMLFISITFRRQCCCRPALLHGHKHVNRTS